RATSPLFPTIMIVPRNKLLFWVTVVVLPFALLAGLAPDAAPVCAVFVGGLGIAALADALGARERLGGIRLEVAPIIRLSKDHEAKLEIRIQNEAPRQKFLRVALGLPPEIPAV